MSFVRWLIAVIVIAAIAHGAALYFGPSLKMTLAMGGMADRDKAMGGTGVNHMFHAVRPNADNNAIVRSSPDLLYSTCVYDVSEKPLLLTAEVPSGTYWSAAFYDLNTNNYRVINDGQATTGGIRVLVVKAGTPSAETPAGAETIVSPTERGLVLIRTLVNDDANFAAIDAVRKQAACSPLGK